MNYNEINRLKNVFSHLSMGQNIVRNLDYGIDGRIVAIGYHPYWTGQNDTKIEKLELSFLSDSGVLVPLLLKNIVDFNILPKENRRSRKYRMTAIELTIFNEDMRQLINTKNEKDIYEKIKLDIIYDD